MNDRNERSGLGSALHDLNALIFEKNKTLTGIIGAFVILGATIGVFWWEADSKAGVTISGSRIRSIIRMIEVGSGVSDIPGIAGYIETKETRTASDYLGEEASIDFPINASDILVIRTINATLSWSDEPDIRRIRNYENQPDEFTVRIIDPQGKVIEEATQSNDREGSATMSVPMTLDDYEMIDYKGKGDFSIEVTLNSAGDFKPRLGIRTIPDNGNDFSLEYIIISYNDQSV